MYDEGKRAPRDKSPTQKMFSLETFDALLRCRQAQQDVRLESHALGIALLDIPTRRDVDAHNGQARGSKKGQGSVERRANGPFEREPEDRVEDDIRGRQCAAKCVGLGGWRQCGDLHVVALRFQTLSHADESRGEAQRP